MRARQLIDGATLGPDALKAIGQAFDAAWDEIADRFDEPLAVEATRLPLANIILSTADENSRDVQELKRAALQRPALGYRSRSGPG
jgi:hypothetical protein